MGPHSTITYSSVIARDSIRLAFFITTLNDLNILGADIEMLTLTQKLKKRCIQFWVGLRSSPPGSLYYNV
jgi:hypothetical protein